MFKNIPPIIDMGLERAQKIVNHITGKEEARFGQRDTVDTIRKLAYSAVITVYAKLIDQKFPKADENADTQVDSKN